MRAASSMPWDTAYPTAWWTFDTFRRDRGESPDFDWPDWCYLPIAAGYAVVSGGGDQRVSVADASRPAIVTALGTWRMTQGIYRFDPALLDAVLETPLDGDIPAEHLQRLPEWCVYVDLTGAELHVPGAWLHMEYDIARGGLPEFRIVFDSAADPRQPLGVRGLEPLAVPLVGTIDESLAYLARSAHHQATLAGFADWPQADAAQALMAQRDIVRTMLALALYLCADADLTRRGAPAQQRNPSPTRSGGGRWTLHAASGPTEWDVGTPHRRGIEGRVPARAAGWRRGSIRPARAAACAQGALAHRAERPTPGS